MDVNDLPVEILIKIFSYLSQRDLFTFYKTICELWNQLSLSREFWRKVEFADVYGKGEDFTDHFYNIQCLVEKLTIAEADLNDLFRDNEDMRLLNLKCISVPVIHSCELIDNIVNKCPNVKELKFGCDSTTDLKYCFQQFSQLQLASLDISYCTYDMIPDINAFIINQANLRKLTLRVSLFHIDDTVNVILGHCTTLESLALINDYVSNRAFGNLRKPLAMQELLITSKELEDSGIDNITKLSPLLKTLNIRRCKSISDTGITFVANNCPLLKKIMIGNTFPLQHMGITSLGLIALAKGCPSLTYLSVTGCPRVDDSGITSVVNSCKSLKHIILKGCTEITDASLHMISNSCLLVNAIDLSGCDKITLDGIIHLITSSMELTTLILSFCAGIRDNTQSKYRNLLNLQEGTNARKRRNKPKKPERLTERTKIFDKSTQRGSKVNEIILRGCTNLTETSVFSLIKICPNLTKLSLPILKLKNTEAFINDLFSLCSSLNKFLLHERIVDREFPNIYQYQTKVSSKDFQDLENY